MAILVDVAIWPWRGRQWAHLVSDSSHDELHSFAAQLGIPRRAFQGDHYDVPSELRERAIELGAEAVSGRELITRLRASGLRRPQRPRTVSPAGPSGRGDEGPWGRVSEEGPAGPRDPVGPADRSAPG